jgi:hypothetical protein
VNTLAYPPDLWRVPPTRGIAPGFRQDSTRCFKKARISTGGWPPLQAASSHFAVSCVPDAGLLFYFLMSRFASSHAQSVSTPDPQGAPVPGEHFHDSFRNTVPEFAPRTFVFKVRKQVLAGQGTAVRMCASRKGSAAPEAGSRSRLIVALHRAAGAPGTDRRLPAFRGSGRTGEREADVRSHGCPAVPEAGRNEGLPLRAGGPAVRAGAGVRRRARSGGGEG